jgi:type I restriction enzyme S subunit
VNHPVVKLEEIAEVRLGRQRSPKNHVGTHMRHYLRAANVGWDGLKLDDVKHMNFTDAEMALYSLRPGDLLLTEASGSPGEVGKPALWSGELAECAIQNTLIRVRPHAADSRFLLHFFRHQAQTGAFAAGSRGVGINHLGQAALAAWPVPLPPLDEQRRIAAILDQADGIVATRRKVMARQTELAHAVFREMFSGQAWTTYTLAELLDFLTSGSRGWAKHYADSGDLFLRIQNVKGGRLDLTDIAFVKVPDTAEARRTRVRPGDVLLSITADLGRVAVVPESVKSAYINQHLSILRSSKVSPCFLAAYLASPPGQAQINKRNRGGVKAGLNFDDIRSFEIPLPPRHLQEAFGQRAAAIEFAGRRIAEHDVVLQGMRTALQSRAFSGGL